jgi:hypothetical protein
MTPARRPLCARASILPVLLTLLGLMMMVDAASAQPINGRARWCALFPIGGSMDCAYHTLEQCMAASAGVNNGCSLNPWYDKRLDVWPRPRSRYWPFF